uniref:Interferon gamma n=1 Tax=Sparus aurata TaxID=8175 RepID=A0A671VRI5_SPAAU
MVSPVREAVCLILMVALCQVRGAYIRPKMNQTIQSLLRHYRIDDEKRFDGNNVFPKEPPAVQMKMYLISSVFVLQTKLLFMGGILESYEKLLGHIPTPSTAPPAMVEAGPSGDVRKDLRYILTKVQELKKKSFHEQEMILHGLQDLKHVQMDNFVVQSKALWELPWLYEEASSLSDNSERRRRRRRRQARKTQLRG